MEKILPFSYKNHISESDSVKAETIVNTKTFTKEPSSLHYAYIWRTVHPRSGDNAHA